MTGAPAVQGGRADLRGLEALLDAAGGSPRVLRYPHETEPDEDGARTEWSCDVLVADDVPAPGYTTYATVGVRGFPTNLATADGRPIRSELVAVSRTGWRAMADVLDACALALASGSFHVVPGTVIPGALAVIESGHSCGHMLLVPPFLWPDLQVVDEAAEVDDGETVTLTRLQAVPVTSAEMRHAADYGHDSLFGLLDAARTDVTNPDRPSTV